MSVCKPGTTVIDALTLCYKAEDDFLAYMREVSESIDFDKFSLYRTKGERHSQYFNVKLYGTKVASLYFDRYGANGKEPYIWFRIDNYELIYQRKYQKDGKYNSGIYLDNLLAFSKLH